MIWWLATSNLGIHFIIGFGGFFLIGALLLWHEWHRWPFIFGHGFFGSKNYWISWIFVAYAFEVTESLVENDFLRELAWSPIEAIFIVLGAFVADRILSIFEFNISAEMQAIANSNKIKKGLQAIGNLFKR